jgi:hypothetical protein
VILHTGKVFDPSAADQDNGVLLEVVSLSPDIGDDLESAGEADFCDLTKRRVGLLGSRGIDAGTYAATLGTVYECR